MRHLLPVLLLLAACAADPVLLPDAAPADTGTQVCTPGAQVGCTCVGGATGAQVCAADGRGLGACACPDAGGLEDRLAVVDLGTPDAGQPADVTSVDAGDDRPAVVDAGADSGAMDAGVDAAAGDGGVDTGGDTPSTVDAPLVCPSGFGNCDGNDSNGCETPTLNNVMNCGLGGVGSVGCGVVCPSLNGTASCNGGSCAIACSSGFGDCSATMPGCETNTQNSATHCGGCGTRCSGGVNGTAQCAAGTCRLACNAGFADCDSTRGCESDTRSDPANCGACGAVCATPRTCLSGACRP